MKKVISFVVCEYLYNKNPKLSVGQMSKDKIVIVQAKSEVIAANKLNLSKYIRIGKSINNKDSSFNEKILEDVYEALMGAVYLDLGYNTAKHVVYETLLKLDFKRWWWNMVSMKFNTGLLITNQITIVLSFDVITSNMVVVKAQKLRKLNKTQHEMHVKNLSV